MTLSPDMMQPLAQFGAAGLMGTLWLWERTLSRRRERQLTEAHERLMQQRVELTVLIRLVRRNTQAIDRFQATEERVSRLLEDLSERLRSRAA